ncbi:MAG: hypothetical protein ACREPA_03405 [Candidatus Dormibacteraceae bacterium]
MATFVDEVTLGFWGVPLGSSSYVLRLLVRRLWLERRPSWRRVSSGL